MGRARVMAMVRVVSSTHSTRCPFDVLIASHSFRVENKVRVRVATRAGACTSLHMKRKEAHRRWQRMVLAQRLHAQRRLAWRRSVRVSV